MKNSKQILGVTISNVTKSQALEMAASFLNFPGQHTIFTPNPEMIVKAQKDAYFKQVLNTGDLNLCDGFGLWLALKFSKEAVSQLSFPPQRESRQVSTSGFPIRSGMTVEIDRISGVDFMFEICRIAAEQGRSIYLLGSGFDEVVQKTSAELQKRFPNLKIVGCDKGPNIDEWRATDYELKLNIEENEVLIHRINALSPDIIFVAFGMGKQEKWIHEYLSKLLTVKVAMGVGGSFDFISGKTPRAPLFMRKLGLEWLYRLIKEPERLGRIWNATAVFTWKILRQKLYEHSK